MLAWTKLRVATRTGAAVLIDYDIKYVIYQCPPVVVPRYRRNNGAFRCPAQTLRLLDEDKRVLSCEITFEHASIRLPRGCA